MLALLLFCTILVTFYLQNYLIQQIIDEPGPTLIHICYARAAF